MTINRYFIIVFLFLLTFALRVHRFGDLGAHADEAVHLTIAEQLLAGDLLYRDLFENNTPGVDLLLAATFKVTGSSVLFSRLWSIGAAMVTVAALLIAAQQIDFPQSAAANKQRVRDLAGFTASLLFACAPLAIFWSRLSVLTSFKTAAATLSVACALRALKKQSGFLWLLAGMMAGFALLAKTSALAVIGTLGLFLTFWCLRKPSWETIRAGLFCLLGMLVAWLPIAIMLLTQETVGDFFHLLSGVERLEPLADWEGKLVAFQNWSMERPFIPLALLGGILALRAAQPASFLLLIWAGMELIALLLLPNLRFGWNGFSHYALPFIAAASLLAGYGLAYGWQQSSKTHHKLAFMALALLLSMPTFSSLVRDLKYSVYETTYPLPDIEAEVKVGQALALVTANQEPILVLANSIFYHRANRPPANRYFYYPSYLPTSSLATESEAELIATLQDSDVGAVLLSTVHRTQRLPSSIVEILF